jgi:NAD(P)-dependent dehydrogenase (short-subunit alcohol dehydrogenase family)
VVAYPGDIADRARMIEVMAEIERDLGPADILVNNAA